MPTARPGESGTLDYDPAQKHSRGEDEIPARGHRRNGLPADPRSIHGWGLDLDKAKRGVFPRELRSDVRTLRGDVKHWQTATTVVDISNELPGLSPVFGDTLPARGLAGALRHWAYEYGEGTSRHWMTLMLADRVERVGRSLADVLRGRPDNIFAEKAWRTRLTHRAAERSDSATKMTAAIAVLAGVGALMLWQARRD